MSPQLPLGFPKNSYWESASCSSFHCNPAEGTGAPSVWQLSDQICLLVGLHPWPTTFTNLPPSCLGETGRRGLLSEKYPSSMWAKTGIYPTENRLLWWRMLSHISLLLPFPFPSQSHKGIFLWSLPWKCGKVLGGKPVNIETPTPWHTLARLTPRRFLHSSLYKISFLLIHQNDHLRVHTMILGVLFQVSRSRLWF